MRCYPYGRVAPRLGAELRSNSGTTFATIALLLGVLCCFASSLMAEDKAAPAAISPEHRDFFEKHVRPLFGRTPFNNTADAKGREHHPWAFSSWLAGERPSLHATILHQLGLDHTRLNFTHNGRPERLTDPEVTGARVVNEVLA